MVRIEWNDAALAAWLDAVGGEVTDDLASEVVPVARDIAPVRTGRLRSSLIHGTDRDLGFTSAYVAAKWYGWFMDPPARQLHRPRPFLPTALFTVVNGRDIHLG